MKKLHLFPMILLFSLSTIMSKAATPLTDTTEIQVYDSKSALKDKIANMTEEEKIARVEEMKKRVEEIRAMDKSTLTREDKKALRKELRSMNKQAKELGHGGIYLSLAGIIIIVLLLIIIF